jgi:hypothetical protein
MMVVLMARSALVGAVIALTALSGCSSSGGKRSCGSTPYTFTVNGRSAVTISTCAGNLSGDASPMSVTVGDTIQVSSAPGGYNYTDPIPVSQNPRIVQATAHTGSTATFRAVAAGTTELSVTSPQCPADVATEGATPRCPLVAVSVGD